MISPKDWVCLECGRRMTFKRAEKAMSDSEGCPGCGGSDIDLYVEPALSGESSPSEELS